MRKIQNNSLIRFYYEDIENIVRNPLPDRIKIRPGDFLRVLVNKYEIGSTDYDNLRVCLLPIEKEPATPILERIPVVGSMGTVRVQMGEKFTHFRLRVGFFQKNTYKQFVLQTESGQVLFMPFGYSGESVSDFMKKLVDHIESNPSFIVRTKVNGSIIDIYMIHNKDFKLASNLSVSLGTVIQTNQNNPSLTSVLINAFLKGASKDYSMIVQGNVVKGNVFTFNGLSYIASTGDTGLNVVEYFTSGELINIPDSESFTLTFDPGSISRNNSRIPSINTFKSSTSGGIDSHTVRLSGQYEVGNVLTVFTSGRTISHTVTPGDTISSMEAILNPDAGFFKVPENTQVSVKGVPGQQVVQNNNVVQFLLNVERINPAVNVEQYGVSVGSDVVKGNEFSIVDPDNEVNISFITNSSSDMFSVAKAISGQENPYFIYERITKPGTIEFTAKRGYAYTQEDIMDISISSQPTIARPNQVVVEIIAPDASNLPLGHYILAIRHSVSGAIKSIAGIVDFDYHDDSSLIETADNGNVFGFHYAEGGLTQRFREFIAIQDEVSTITETVGQNMDGVDQSINTRIGYLAPFASKAIGINQAKALVIALKNSFLRIDERIMRASEVTHSTLSEYGHIAQVYGSMELIGEYVDNHNRMVYPRVFSGANAIISAEYSFDLRLFLCNSTFTREISAETAIPSDGYYLETIGSKPGKGFVRLLIRDQDNVLVEMEINRELRQRSIPFRIQPGARVIIELIEINQINNDGFYPVESVDIPVVYEPEEVVQQGRGFSDGFSNGFY